MESSTTTLRKTPLHAVHRAMGAKMVPFGGWEMPVEYAGLINEHMAVRRAAGLFDVSHMGELHLEGEHALALVDYLVTNDVKKLVDGQALYTVCCNERGTILDDLYVFHHPRGFRIADRHSAAGAKQSASRRQSRGLPEQHPPARHRDPDVLQRQQGIFSNLRVLGGKPRLQAVPG